MGICLCPFSYVNLFPFLGALAAHSLQLGRRLQLTMSKSHQFRRSGCPGEPLEDVSHLEPVPIEKEQMFFPSRSRTGLGPNNKGFLFPQKCLVTKTSSKCPYEGE
jgi:hypothetical protein